MSRVFFYSALLVGSIMFFSSCAYRAQEKVSHGAILASSDTQASQKTLTSLQDFSLHIRQPENVMVHYNLAPCLYEELWHHFKRVGYQIDEYKHDYILTSKILSWHIPEKLISPDVVVYGYRLKITVQFNLICAATLKIVESKTFSQATMISGAKDPGVSSCVLDHEMHTLCERLAVKVDLWIRLKIRT